VQYRCANFIATRYLQSAGERNVRVLEALKNMENIFGNNLFKNLMEIWIIPSINERQASGEIENPLDLQMAQLIFKSDELKAQVRINGEVKGKMIVNLKNEFTSQAKEGNSVDSNHLESIDAFELEDSDRNCGHATLIAIRSNWYIFYNFIYNREESQTHLLAAKEFLYAAEMSFQAGFFRATIDNLVSASELSAKAYLLRQPDKVLVQAKSHDVIHKKINLERRLGNVKSEHVDTFNTLRNLRADARYLHSDLTITSDNLIVMLKDVGEFIECVNQLSEKKL